VVKYFRKKSKMNIQEYINSLKRSSKFDDVPGTVAAYLDEKCPACGKKMKLMKPCCNSKFGTKVCLCGYKVILTS
jgi:hypothetical protein